MGLIEGPEAGEILAEVGFAVRKAVEDLPVQSRLDDEAVRQAARIAVRRSFNATQGKKPLTEVHLVRL
jgi:ribonuclease J